MTKMKKLWYMVILAIPTIILTTRHEEKKDLFLEFLLILILFFFGSIFLKISGCFKMMGLMLIILGLIAYYFLMIAPLFTGKIILINI